MKKAVLLLTLAFAQLIMQAQPGGEKYARRIKASALKKQLKVIAGAGMEGRGTATEGQRKAAAYIEGQFKSAGLKAGNQGSYQQVFPLYEDSMLSSGLRIGDRTYAYGKDYMMSASANSNSRVKGSSIVFAGYGISDSLYDDYAEVNVKGAIVVLALGEPLEGDSFIMSGTNRGTIWSTLNKKKAVALAKGAVGILVVSPRLLSIDPGVAANGSKTGMYLQSADRQVLPINAANISRAVFREIFPQSADSLLAVLSRSQPFSGIEHPALIVSSEFDYSKSTYVKGNSSNVLGVIEGTDKKDEYVFLTAHYDHLGIRDNVIYYGADDDGSGTVSVIEMAKAFANAAANGARPRRSIVFMTVSGEEKGLWGSEYYSDHPIFPLEKTSVDLNTDMVGRIDPKRVHGDSQNYIYVIGDDKLSSELKRISESVNNKYAHLELDYKYNDPKDPERIYYRSDHYNFARKGVPVIFYFNGTHADYHQPTDTVDKINFKLMEKRVRFIFMIAWEMANRDDMLKRDIPL